MHLASVNADLSPVIAGRLKANLAVNEGKKGMVPTYPHIVARMDACAPLTN